MKAERNNLGYIAAIPGTNNSRDSNAWFTPAEYVDMAREVMGTIDLDPYSCDSANTRVNATRYFDINDDANKQIWFSRPGTVYMNPPYGRGEMANAVNRFMGVFASGMITEAIVLVNNATETKWFQELLKSASAVCFPNRRIAFENDDGKNISSNTRGQAFIYFGVNADRFHQVFSRIGRTVDIY